MLNRPIAGRFSREACVNRSNALVEVIDFLLRETDFKERAIYQRICREPLESRYGSHKSSLDLGHIEERKMKPRTGVRSCEIFDLLDLIVARSAKAEVIPAGCVVRSRGNIDEFG